MTEHVPGNVRALALFSARDPQVASIWRTLEAAARPSYFLTWGWIETWLAALPHETWPRFAVIFEGGTAVAACFLGRRRWLRHGIVPVRGLFLHTTGVPRYDELCVEHNRVLSLPGTTGALETLVELLPRDWDELVLPAADCDGVEQFTATSGYRVLVDRETPAPFVDLARVRATGDYLSLLSSNTRAQIRRARRDLGTCELQVATSAAHALEIYQELVALHTASWRARGDAGAFADPWFDGFHRRLIERRFAHGEIELLRLVAGGKTIGCIYNLISNDRVLFYQSGLARFEDPRIKPGYLCHAAAIEHAAARGRAIYDLLGGDSRYKESLSTGTTRLIWIRVQRRLARFALEDHWKRAYVAWRTARAG